MEQNVHRMIDCLLTSVFAQPEIVCYALDIYQSFGGSMFLPRFIPAFNTLCEKYY